ncbi:pyridoxamine 5'-phosphate oxidase [Plectosphaerella plurivora]|uniref:Pyridoxamine 5'-phosphate oxidase n=1 Tax=Plectosphaerella plurivora TaxID=936078 RepID=A0A9P8VA27_9PEZI|nr:pyridoxamine 5'-phosphate oxidase [Plectosphaerella plurivora]
MSSQQFSNTSTGEAPADPYKAANKDDAPLDQKVTDFVNFATAVKFGMMTTRNSNSDLVSRAMAIAGTEAGGVDLLFHTNTESHKTDEISSDPHTNISFYNSSGDWASVSGESSVITDRDLVKKTYSPALKAWLGDLGDGKHDGSENDPRIGVIRVKAKSITYAINNRNVIGRIAQVAEGVVTGSPAQVNKLREISPSEIQQWRSTNSS